MPVVPQGTQEEDKRKRDGMTLEEKILEFRHDASALNLSAGEADIGLIGIVLTDIAETLRSIKERLPAPRWPERGDP